MDRTEPDLSALARSLQNAVVLGDSKGDDVQAARIVDGALRRSADSAGDVVERIAALVYRAELAIRLEDEQGADQFLAELGRLTLDDAERERAQTDLDYATEVRTR